MAMAVPESTDKHDRLTRLLSNHADRWICAYYNKTLTVIDIQGLLNHMQQWHSDLAICNGTDWEEISRLAEVSGIVGSLAAMAPAPCAT
jgi:ferritin-like protein